MKTDITESECGVGSVLRWLWYHSAASGYSRCCLSCQHCNWEVPLQNSTAMFNYQLKNLLFSDIHRDKIRCALDLVKKGHCTDTYVHIQCHIQFLFNWPVTRGPVVLGFVWTRDILHSGCPSCIQNKIRVLKRASKYVLSTQFHHVFWHGQKADCKSY